MKANKYGAALGNAGPRVATGQGRSRAKPLRDRKQLRTAPSQLTTSADDSVHSPT
jgi:hypothetical protein